MAAPGWITCTQGNVRQGPKYQKKKKKKIISVQTQPQGNVH